jgi:hypothetical protein
LSLTERRRANQQVAASKNFTSSLEWWITALGRIFMKKFGFAIFALFSINAIANTSPAAKAVWTAAYAYSDCAWGKDQFKVQEGDACSKEGDFVDLVVGGTKGYECDPVTVVQYVCCGDKVKCESVIQEPRLEPYN